MVAGDRFSPAQHAELRRAVEHAEAVSGLDVRLYVGPLEQGRSTARQLHAGSEDPARTVLVAVDPARRTVEIVTGHEAGERCEARSCALATAAMTSSFAAGDLFGGLRDGVNLLAAHARRPRLLHADTL